MECSSRRVRETFSFVEAPVLIDTFEDYNQMADILLCGYVGWNSRCSLQVSNEVFPKDAAVQLSLVIFHLGLEPHPRDLSPHVPLPKYVENMRKITIHLKSLSEKTRIIFLTAPAVNEAQITEVFGPGCWQPWGKLEAWRERGIRDSIFCRFHILSEGQECGDLLMSEILISAEKGGEFYIDTDRQVGAAASPLPSPRSSGDFAALSPVAGGFVMSCRVQGEGKCSKLLVQLAMRHVTCVEDAAIFMALAAAFDLSIEACRPFRRWLRRSTHRSW